jgi:spermidine synthase
MKKGILSTAFLEGLCVLIVEIAGARALAPFFGSSLRVWTAQITATLLFLALGYGLGGKLSRSGKLLALPGVFWGAGLWLALYPWLRTGVLGTALKLGGVASGSFIASAVLFGPVLLGLGAVSPLLIQKHEELERSEASSLTARAGSAAGAIFFTNTMGGLAGGWLTALVLIPHGVLRVVLAATGLALVLLGSLWAWPLKRRAAALGLPLLALVALSAAPKPLRAFNVFKAESHVLYSKESGVGLIQVLDIGQQGYSQALALLIDGITQGGIDRETGLTLYEFSAYQDQVAWRYHPQAKRALLLGLGTGVLAKSLSERGLSVDVAEIEPSMEGVARTYFGLPAAVRVHPQDGRAFLERSEEKWDLIFLDAFAGENTPWYLMTEEGLRRVQAHLAPGGRMIVNSVTEADGRGAGLRRIEAGLKQVFGEGLVFVDPKHEAESSIVNACLVAGAGLKAGTAPFPGKSTPYVQHKVDGLWAAERPLQADPALLTHDERSDLDLADAPLRQQWRKLVLDQFGASVLGD